MPFLELAGLTDYDIYVISAAALNFNTSGSVESKAYVQGDSSVSDNNGDMAIQTIMNKIFEPNRKDLYELLPNPSLVTDLTYIFCNETGKCKPNLATDLAEMMLQIIFMGRYTIWEEFSKIIKKTFPRLTIPEQDFGKFLSGQLSLHQMPIASEVTNNK